MDIRSCYIEGRGLMESFFKKEEADALCLRLFEDCYGISREELILHGDRVCDFHGEFIKSVHRICEGCPIQHIAGWQEFLGRKFSVSPDVLIPRVETEELVTKITGRWRKTRGLSVLDIGTGSGVIAISLALELPESYVTAIDIGALDIAKENCRVLGAEVEFLHMDFLRDSDILKDRKCDIIVSNPPYIPEEDKEGLPTNVYGHDPDRALFVSNEEPLLFYTSISRYAWNCLREGGALYFEINEKFGSETCEEVRNAGFKDVYLEKDINGKDRFVWSIKQ